MAVPKKTTKQSGKQTRSRKQEPPRPAYGRAVGGAVCLLLALFVIVSYFGVDALFLRFFGGLLKGLTGYGYYAFGPALLLAGYWLLNRKESPVTLRTVCALLLPVVLGTTLHLFLCEPMRFSSALPKELWDSGCLMESGGALSGCLAVGGAAVFSKVAMLILCLLLLAVMLIGALHISLTDLVAGARERAAQRREEEEEELPPAPRREEKKAAPLPVRAKQPIDIPLEEKNVSLPERQKPGGFFARRSASVKTPDEVLLPRTEAPSSAPEAPMAPAVAAAPVISAELPVPVAEESAAEEKKPAFKRQSRKEPEISHQEVAQAAEEVSRQIEGVQDAAENSYQYPPITLLEENLQQNYTEVGAELRNNSRRLAETLHSFGVDATAGEVVHGPSVTRYEFVLDQGVKLSKITNLSDDIALALGASGVRIAPIPNKISVVGIEVPNRAVTAVRIRDVVESREFTEHKSHTAFAIGKDIGGSNIVGDVAKLPHGAADFFGDDHTAQIIDPANNSSCFHIINSLDCIMLSMLYRYCLQKKEGYAAQQKCCRSFAKIRKNRLRKMRATEKTHYIKNHPGALCKRGPDNFFVKRSAACSADAGDKAGGVPTELLFGPGEHFEGGNGLGDHAAIPAVGDALFQPRVRCGGADVVGMHHRIGVQ